MVITEFVVNGEDGDVSLERLELRDGTVGLLVNIKETPVIDPDKYDEACTMLTEKQAKLLYARLGYLLGENEPVDPAKD